MRKLKLSYQALALLLVVGLGAVTRAEAAGDAGHGGDVFDAECSDCHSLKQGKNKKGNNLSLKKSFLVLPFFFPFLFSRARGGRGARGAPPGAPRGRGGGV